MAGCVSGGGDGTDLGADFPARGDIFGKFININKYYWRRRKSDRPEDRRVLGRSTVVSVRRFRSAPRGQRSREAGEGLAADPAPWKRRKKEGVVDREPLTASSPSRRRSPQNRPGCSKSGAVLDQRWPAPLVVCRAPSTDRVIRAAVDSGGVHDLAHGLEIDGGLGADVRVSCTGTLEIDVHRLSYP